MTAETKRAYDRQYRRDQRAAMTPEERREYRRQHDATYRERHRDERRTYDRERRPGRKKVTQ